MLLKIIQLGFRLLLSQGKLSEVDQFHIFLFSEQQIHRSFLQQDSEYLLLELI